MTSNVNKGIISAPGRICLFGEHQDYLGLPVVPMAINKRLSIHYTVQKGSSMSKLMKLRSNQFEEIEAIRLDSKPLLTGSPYDYQKAVLIYFWDRINQIKLSSINIDSHIPIRAGLSSSAAILTAMVFLISILLEETPSLNLEKIAEIAYNCEHEILNIACGRMDQYSSSLGGIFHMTPELCPKITRLNLSNDALFIIGNSGIERKADLPLKSVQKDIHEALHVLDNPDLKKISINNVAKANKLTPLHRKRLMGVIGVRNNAGEAFKELKKSKTDLIRIGQLLTEQQNYLRENYQVSHPKLDKMCEIALKNGALGSKLTGAGFGGCMFALTDNVKVASKIKKELQKLGDSFLVKMDSGVSRA
jgi:galactokinase